MKGHRFPYRTAGGVLAAGLLMLGAAFACQPSDSTRTGATDMAAPAGFDPVVAVVMPVGPTGKKYGVPTGWHHDRRGAEAAAAAYVETSGLVATAGALARRDAVLVIATPGYGPILAAGTDRRLDDLLFSLGERKQSRADLIWSEHALTLHSTARSADEIEVRVWSVVVLATRGGSVPRQVWRTSTLTLRWVHDDWKVDRWSTETGPLPAPPAEIDTSSVAAIAEVTGWPTAPSGGGS